MGENHWTVSCVVEPPVTPAAAGPLATSTHPAAARKPIITITNTGSGNFFIVSISPVNRLIVNLIFPKV